MKVISRVCGKTLNICCAYCLRQDRNFGGEACGEIDHFCPRSVNVQLLNEYTNLYWSCRECNSNKADDWPTTEQAAQGYAFVDPCRDGFTQHYFFENNGLIAPLTPQAEYTIFSLLLWRESLVVWRRETIEAFQEVNRIERLLQDLNFSKQQRQLYTQLLQEYKKKINPPVFNRARKRDGQTKK